MESTLVREAWELNRRLYTEYQAADPESLRRWRLAAAATRSLGRFQRRALKAVAR